MNEQDFGLKGSVRSLAQRKQSRPTSERLQLVPDHNSFDVFFSLSGQVLQQTSHTYGGAIHHSTRFEYDEAGRLIRTTTSDSSEVSLETSELVYPVGQCVWVKRDGGGVMTSRGVDDYDGEYLILASTFDIQDRLKRSKNFEYLNNRLRKSDSKYYGGDGVLYERSLAEYDSEGRIQRSYGLKQDGSPLGDGKYSYEYDAEGRIAKHCTFSEFEADEIASKVTIYKYVNDDVGNWIERRESHLWRNDSYASEAITTRKLAYYR
jgi:YD repeat-containing protein